MKRFAAALIAILFTAPTQAQTTWEYYSTEDAVWTETAEDTATVYLVRGVNDYEDGSGELGQGSNTLCEDIAVGLGLIDDPVKWPNVDRKNGPPSNWPASIMRVSASTTRKSSGTLSGVNFHKCWDDHEWIFVAERHSEVGSRGTLTIQRGSGNPLIVFVRVVESRDALPSKDPIVVTSDPKVKYPDICTERPINSEHLQNCRARWPHLVEDVSHELGETANGPSEVELDEDAAVKFEEDVSAERETPETFALEQNYPNPFNPSTTIAFALDKTQHVLLSVYDLLGQEVRVLLDGVQPAGRYHVPFDAGNLASGTYVYVIQTEEQVVAKTMSLLK